MRHTRHQHGVGLIEVVIGVAVVIVVLLGLVGAYVTFVRVARHNTELLKADYLLEEGVEAVRLIRDDGWANINTLATDTTYYLAFSGGRWTPTTTPEVIDRFSRSISFADVYRNNATFDIEPMGNLDDGSRELTVTVSWEGTSGTETETLKAYVTKFVET
jgi:Tfp pilus assembly protein PilV